MNKDALDKIADNSDKIVENLSVLPEISVKLTRLFWAVAALTLTVGVSITYWEGGF